VAISHAVAKKPSFIPSKIKAPEPSPLRLALLYRTV
jgi:hypothetical protein